MTRKVQTQPKDLYLTLMTNVRARFEIVEGLNLNSESGFAAFETAAFHLRKSIEGVAFGCLVAFDQAFKEVPRDARGQWNADNIFIRLKRRETLVFPESFRRENPPEGSDPAVKHHMVACPDINLAVDQVRDIYRRSHKWLHEWNPYIERLGNDIEKSKAELLADLPRFWNWILQHKIGIGGHIFLGLLKDPTDNQVRIISAESLN